ncbi:hypothetical protein GCM10028817_47370 [Spirosoma pomorum]
MGISYKLRTLLRQPMELLLHLPKVVEQLPPLLEVVVTLGKEKHCLITTALSATQ